MKVAVTLTGSRRSGTCRVRSIEVADPPEMSFGTCLKVRLASAARAAWLTAYRFLRGYRLRVQVASGAHPRFVRNLGAGDPLASGTRMGVAEQQIHHDPARPSASVLPVLGG